MFKKKYYIVTSDTEDIGLRMYYIGRMSKKESEEYMQELTKKYPVLWLMVTGRGLREVARNKVKIKDMVVAATNPTSKSIISSLVDGIPSDDGGSLAN